MFVLTVAKSREEVVTVVRLVVFIFLCRRIALCCCRWA